MEIFVALTLASSMICLCLWAFSSTLNHKLAVLIEVLEKHQKGPE